MTVPVGWKLLFHMNIFFFLNQRWAFPPTQPVFCSVVFLCWKIKITPKKNRRCGGVSCTGHGHVLFGGKLGSWILAGRILSTLPKFSSSPLKIGRNPKGKDNSSSNHHFSGAMLKGWGWEGWYFHFFSLKRDRTTPWQNDFPTSLESGAGGVSTKLRPAFSFSGFLANKQFTSCWGGCV